MNRIDEHEWEATQRAAAKHPPRYWRISMWAWRALVVIVFLLLCALCGTKELSQPHYPPGNMPTRTTAVQR